MESAASFGHERKPQNVPDDANKKLKRQLLTFSAKHPKSLEAAVQKHEEYITTNPDSLHNMAYTLNTKRTVHQHRAFCVTDGLDSFDISKIAKPALGTKNDLVFVFTGQGAQWARMGRELLESEPVFKAVVDSLDIALSQLADGPTWKMRGDYEVLPLT
jgi:acyl transferase domain-containing protein